MPLYHTPEALDERTRERLTSMLGADERFVLAVTVSDGLYKRHRSRLVLTDAHLYRIRHGYGVYVEAGRYALADLTAPSLSGGGRAELELTTSEGESLTYPLEPDDAAEFADALRRGIAWHATESDRSPSR